MPEEPSMRSTTPRGEDEDDLRCRICDLKFETISERNVHILAHPQDCPSEEDILIRRQLFYREVKKQQEEGEPNFGENVKFSPPKAQHKPRRIYKPPSKRVGLTKIRMEDCLRCDACSCIYIDPQDYYKHMRNFHQKYNTVIPRTRRRSPVGRIVNREIRMPVQEEVRIRHVQQKAKEQKPLDTSFIAESIIRQSIKSRWSKVSERLSVAKRPRLAEPTWDAVIAENTSYDPNIKIKEEPPDDDVSYLLSQVEVRIKTEPTDDYCSY